jgi:hydroxymethylpyrimidine/phosphomethylpyrimidine kinase
MTPPVPSSPQAVDRPSVLTIAGSDPSGGAGLQADLKTFHQHGAYGMTVVTLVTVQNTQGVSDVHILPAELVERQLQAVVDDIPPRAAKTGALGNAAIMETVGHMAARSRFPWVVDPVMISKHGHPLLGDEAIAALVRHVLPRADVLTPNRAEAARLAGCDVVDRTSMLEAARRIADLGPRWVLLKGAPQETEAVDLWWDAAAPASEQAVWLTAPRSATPHLHGAGCALAAALTARLAWGDEPLEAARAAKRFVSAALQAPPGLGHGIGPLDLHAPVGLR